MIEHFAIPQTGEVTSHQDVMVGIHFEHPLHRLVMGMPAPWTGYVPSGNRIGMVMLNAWILRELDHSGLRVPAPEGIDAMWGELNCCTGVYSVTHRGKGLQVIADVLASFYPETMDDPVLELAWYCGAEHIWRMWRPAESTNDFGRHVMPEARERGSRELADVIAAIKAATAKLRGNAS